MEEIEIDLKHLGNEVLLFSIVFLVFLFLSLFFWKKSSGTTNIQFKRNTELFRLSLT